MGDFLGGWGALSLRDSRRFRDGSRGPGGMKLPRSVTPHLPAHRSPEPVLSGNTFPDNRQDHKLLWRLPNKNGCFNFPSSGRPIVKRPLHPPTVVGRPQVGSRLA